MPVLQIAIQFDPTTGAIGVNVSDEIKGNAVLINGLIETAKEALADARKQAQNRVQLAPPGSTVPAELPKL